MRDLHCPDGYVLDAPFEGGAFFRVFSVTRGEERYVCKRPSARFAHDPGARAVLENEARVLGKLGGRAAPRLVAHGDDPRGPYLVSTYAAGEPLGTLRGAGAPGPTLSLVHRLYEALSRVHAEGVVHGDPSPSNVLVDRDTVTLVDFGLARLALPHADGAAPRAHASAGRFRGTLLYSAPEIARGEDPTYASDVFALAASLLHVLRGEPPRRAPSPAAMLLEAAESPLDRAPLDALGAGLGRALDPRPEARPDATELVLAASLLRGRAASW